MANTRRPKTRAAATSTVEALVRRATGGRRLDRARMFRPSLAYQVLEDPWSLWCDFHAPADAAVDETTRYERLRMGWGNAHEAAWVRAHHPDAVEIEPLRDLPALRATATAMREGAPAIHAPQLWALGAELHGKGDVIVRCDDAPSDLGGWHYRVIEIKRSAHLKPYHAVQAGAYNRALAAIQGYRPPAVEVVLRDGTERVPADDADAALDAVLATWRGIRDGKDKPEMPAFDEAGSPWRVYTNRLLEKAGDLTCCPVVSASARRKLHEKAGVRRLADLGALSVDECRAALGPVVGREFHLKLRAWTTAAPVLAPGATLAIPRAKRRLYFDFETSGSDHPGIPEHAYMIGCLDGDGDAFRVFVARGADDEARMFGEFLDHVGNPRDARLYHWTGYELGVIRDVAGRHPRLGARLDALVRSCVDLKDCIAKTVFFGARTYSIKEVAPFLGFRWRQADVDAMESMVLYWDWLAGAGDAAIDKVKAYNEDDCRAMVHVHRAVEGLVR